MATEIFDRETMLDLTVNFIPLFIILFFIVAFAVFNPWGVDSLATGIQYALLVAPFVFLAVLTYFSARAIAGDERRGEEGALPSGEATVPADDALDNDEEDAEAAELTAADDEGDEPAE